MQTGAARRSSTLSKGSVLSKGDSHLLSLVPVAAQEDDTEDPVADSDTRVSL